MSEHSVDRAMSEPAFPTDSESQVGPNVWHYSGLTKRELFAAMAMASIIANPAIDELRFDEVASDAKGYADALLSALNESGEGK